MMLITPAIASEPYSADAPSVRISMRSTAPVGIVFRSTAAETPDAEDSLTQRKPSTRISVRFAFKLRSEIVVEPEPTPEPSGAKPKLPAELNFVLSDEPLTGVARIAGREQHLDRWPRRACGARDIGAGYAAGQNDVGEQKIDARIAFEDTHRTLAIGSFQHAVAEIAQRIDGKHPHAFVVLDD